MFGLSKEEKAINNGFKQLDYLNAVIREREEQASLLPDLTDKIALLKLEHVELAEYDSLAKAKIELEEQIKQKRKELEAITNELSSLGEIVSIESARKKLEEEKEALTYYRKSLVNPKDIIIVAYTVPNIDDIAIDAFVFQKYEDYHNKDGYPKRGAVYNSLGGGRTIGFTPDFTEPLYSNYPVFNAEPKQFVTFEEACLALGLDLYLKEKVSTLEIHEVLQSFKSGFYFYGKTNITIDEFMEMIRLEKKEYDGNLKLERLLEKGETK